MEITAKEFQHVELITIKGRMDSIEAPLLAQALESAYHRGKYRIVVDMGQLEYMSSAGFRALGDAQRNSKRHHGGEVILAQVSDRIHEALELVGFTESFRIIDDVPSALDFAANLPAGDSSADVKNPLPERNDPSGIKLK
jgi:anti-sigma B factor antagonist